MTIIISMQTYKFIFFNMKNSLSFQAIAINVVTL
ncbi:MAG: hypothetical protein KatS3mg035_0958 [Bacteroidia bacterium]|nr:MAG: hypothetical protein KatS3mg035_0958 [Bacteroidia bacterium]